jgi:hypothetical protein
MMKIIVRVRSGTDPRREVSGLGRAVHRRSA